MERILILGAKSDIARALAHRFARAGYDIILAARRAEELQNDGALNLGLVTQLEGMTGEPFRIPENPRIVNALGAAIHAFAKRSRRERETRPSAQPQG